MKFAKRSLFSGLMIFAGVAAVGLTVHAHERNPHAERIQNDDRTSITGSPEALSERARELGEHICATIKASTDCAITPISDKAANELAAMQAGYAQGQQRLHITLTAATFDRAAFDRIEAEQVNAIEASATRYMQFLGEAAAALRPEQRQMFSRNGHSGH